MGFRMHFQPQCIDTDVVRGSVPDSVSNDRYRAFWRDLLAEKRKGRPIVSSTPYLEFSRAGRISPSRRSTRPTSAARRDRLPLRRPAREGRIRAST